MQSSILNAISFLNKAKNPSKAYLALFKKMIFRLHGFALSLEFNKSYSGS